MRTWRNRCWTTGLAALVAVSLAGSCGRTAGTNDQNSSSSVPRTGQVVSPAMLDLLTQSGSYPRTHQQIAALAHRITSGCMKAAGFQAPPPDPAPSDHVNLAERARTGYGLDPGQNGAGGEQLPPAYAAYLAGLSPSEQERHQATLVGAGGPTNSMQLPDGRQIIVNLTGCDAETRKALGGDVVTWARVEYVPESLAGSLDEQVGQHPAYRQAMRAWAACMRAAGHPYPSAEAAQVRLRDQYKEQGSSPAVRRLERAVAVADGRCAQRSRLPLAAVDARRELATRLPAGQLTELRELTEKWLEAGRRAS